MPATKASYRSFVDVIAASDGSVPPTDIHILSTGDWDTATHGKFSVTEGDLDEMVRNFNDGVRKGVPIDAEHDTTGGAYGWVNTLYRQGRDLFAKMEWNQKGTVALSDKQYRYFSPEFAPKYRDPETNRAYSNVLLGGAITNRPLMKGLKAIMASEGGENEKGRTLYLNEETSMDLEAIKAKAEADRTPEERDFLATNDKPAIQPEEKPNPDEIKKEKEEEAPVAASEGMVSISAAEKAKYDEIVLKFGELQASEARAKEDLRVKSCAEKVQGLLFSETNKDGRFHPKMKDQITEFVLSLNEGQAADFDKLVEQMPAAGKLLFSEVGVKDGDSDESDTNVVKAGDSPFAAKGEAQKKLEEAAAAIQASAPGTSYGRAMLKARQDNPVLASEASEANQPIKAVRPTEK